MHSTARASQLVVLATLLAAHAGCSSDDSKDSGAGFTMSESSVAFAAGAEGPTPDPEYVAISITASNAAYIVAGYPAGSTPPAWLDLSLTGSAQSWTLTLRITETRLPHGSYATDVRVLIADANQNIIGYRDIAVTYVVSLILRPSPNAIFFDHAIGEATETTLVTVDGSGAIPWTAVASEGWVTLDATSGTTPSNVTVGFDPSGLDPGIHTATVTFTSGAATGILIVTLDLAAAALVASTETLAFSGVNGALFAPAPLSLAMNNGAAVAWSATPGASWVVLDKASGTTPDQISVRVDPSIGPLASGSHSAPIVLSADFGGTTLTRTVQVDLSLTKASLSFAPASLQLGGTDGRDFAARSVQVSLDTGAAAHGWSATPSDPWMVLDATSGTASATPAVVELAPDPTGLLGGTRTGSLAFQATVNGDTVMGSLPVTYNLDGHRLLVSAEGVALTSLPGLQQLSRTLRVTDDLGLAAPWTATADQPWLDVTPSGTADGDLVITADPAELATDTLHFATITVASSDPSVENSETVRVGLWIGSADPAVATVTGAFTEVVADPVRPYVYVHTGGADVLAYHLHTGALVATLSGVGGALGGMTVSGDGSTLYAVSRATFQIVPVDLDALIVGTAWNLATTTVSYPRVAWTRTNGRGLVIATDGTIYDALDGSAVARVGASTYGTVRVKVNRAGNVFCASVCKSLTYSSLGDGTVTAGSRKGGLGSRDGALSDDGEIVYTASGSPYEWWGYSTTTGMLVVRLGSQLPYPGNVETSWDGRIYGGRYSSGTADDVYAFDAGGTLLGSFPLASGSLLDDEMCLSGDGLRMAGVTGSSLRFATIPPMP